MKKKIKFKKWMLPFLTITFISVIGTLGRFIYNDYQTRFLESGKFYFESTELKPEKAVYRVDNYNGVDNYNITIDVNSLKNNNEKANVDISYDITYNCSSNANCSVSKTNGIIYSASNHDTFTANISPSETLEEGDMIWIDVLAKSKDPYSKEISAIFILKVGFYGLSHRIDDQTNSPYFEVKITNTLDYYTVSEAFGSYNVGDRISISTYLGLSAVNKAHCHSALIGLEFDPNLVLLDITNANYKKNVSFTQTAIGGYNYVNSFIFKADAQSSQVVRFYKKNASYNYTYPIINSTSIIDVTYY